VALHLAQVRRHRVEARDRAPSARDSTEAPSEGSAERAEALFLPRAFVGLSPGLLGFGALGTVRCGLARPDAAGTWPLGLKARGNGQSRGLSPLSATCNAGLGAHRGARLATRLDTSTDLCVDLHRWKAASRAIARLAEDLSPLERLERHLRLHVTGGSARDIELGARGSDCRRGLGARFGRGVDAPCLAHRTICTLAIAEAWRTVAKPKALAPSTGGGARSA
jgi:hypothetical protein